MQTLEEKLRPGDGPFFGGAEANAVRTWTTSSGSGLRGWRQYRQSNPVSTFKSINSVCCVSIV